MIPTSWSSPRGIRLPETKGGCHLSAITLSIGSSCLARKVREPYNRLEAVIMSPSLLLFHKPLSSIRVSADPVSKSCFIKTGEAILKILTQTSNTVESQSIHTRKREYTDFYFDNFDGGISNESL